MLFDEHLLIKKININYNRQDTMNNIVANVFYGYLTGREVAISRSSNSYTMPKIYKPDYYSYRKTIPCLDELIKEGFVNQTVGFFDRENKANNKLTRIKPAYKLLRLLGRSEFTQKYPLPLILKDKNKKLVEYRHTEQTKKMSNFLNDCNDFMKNQNFSFNFSPTYYSTSTPPISTTPITTSTPLLITNENTTQKHTFTVSYKRVFNNRNFEQGGRFYTSFQNIKKELRRDIMINGSETCEIDYKGLHIKMLYNLEGIEYEADPYIPIEGFERKEVKLLFQILLNSKNKVQTLRAARTHLNKKLVDIKRALIIIEKKHSRISRYFNSGIGIILQNYDSQIAENILNYFVKEEVPCLCIHDSFIVPESYRLDLTEAMNYNYEEKFNFKPELTEAGESIKELDSKVRRTAKYYS